MKKLTLLTTLIFSVVFSSPSFADWTKLFVDMNGNTNYLDFGRMRKVDGYVYSWVLKDLLKPDKDGDLSYKGYYQGDCKLFRLKDLSVSYHKEPMGRGTGKPQHIPPKWSFPAPNSVNELILKSICRAVN
jgi:hypothetical protein